MKTNDPIRPWFTAMEDAGEYIGIRFGRIAPGASEPQWIFLPHNEVDGIGGFAEIFRKKGETFNRLPQIKHPATPSRLAVLKTLPKFLIPQHRLKWATLVGTTRPSTKSEPPSAVAWHVFSEEETTQIRRVCRKACITVNSFLLKHLTKAIRPCLEDQSSTIPWMIPVNLRGKVNRATDVENHSSYVSVKVRSYDTVHDVHRNIYDALCHGDHWANWYAYESSRLMTQGMCGFLVRTEKYMSEWHIGSFSNLGDWDPEKKISHPDCQGSWLFCPPVLRVQHLGTGCVTFQNKLSLMIQAHPELTTSAESPRGWVRDWVKEIEIDIASILSDPVAMT